MRKRTQDSGPQPQVHLQQSPDQHMATTKAVAEPLAENWMSQTKKELSGQCESDESELTLVGGAMCPS